MIIQINPEDLCWGGHRTCQWSHLSVCHLSVAGSVAQPWCLDLCLSGHLKATHPHPNPQRSHNCSTASATPEGPPIPPALLFQPPSHVRRHPNPTALAYTLSILTAAQWVPPHFVPQPRSPPPTPSMRKSPPLCTMNGIPRCTYLRTDVLPHLHNERKPLKNAQTHSGGGMLGRNCFQRNFQK